MFLKKIKKILKRTITVTRLFTIQNLVEMRMKFLTTGVVDENRVAGGARVADKTSV